ncbi:heme biosynthesis HemY N-terminal domain-containing protein [Phaeobacter sp. QD34_3]|uniref:heme biosynthesis protein HemY n=1 Tax=unclassified Phaeobacter TaxID=2621772 RepID=UPI00237FC9D4|nr:MULTISPECIES: heme biosynthesis HemY N-terminal domain-containing protein [unclassified Phaeobacter]MDE4134913.1 heme biosynthesis HemY N-terminal domain-containing protein [Phaeobacter sp. QD34_3]MDE4138543.1 heme biosynthesis HemY N-terminal domain-containing protein [Phaeobacter sp. QD34_24]
MLWSLLKILVFVAIVALLALGAGILMETAGGVQITVAGTEYTLGALQSVMALVVLVLLVWLFFKLLSLLVATLRFLNGDETALSRYFDKGREAKGYQALSDGMMALASGEGRLALAKASRAARYLEKPELTDLLTAQAAEMAGDTKKAAEAYKRLLGNQNTRFVGIRGIMKQKLSDGDTDTARQLAEKALALRPKHEEVQDTLLHLQARAEDWAGARKTLATKLKTGTLPRDVFKRRDAVLALSASRGVIEKGATIEQQEQAIEANRLSPDLVPAAAMAARAYIARDKTRNAVRILKKAWEAQPHPDLAHAFAEVAPDESAAERVKRFGQLARLKPHDEETRLVMAELNIVAEDFPEARRALGDLVERAPDAQAFTLMAAIERGEGASDAVVQGWLTRALNAPRGPQWICDSCNHIHAEWVPVCENCSSFDTLSWRRPETPEIASATGAHMLPLIGSRPPADRPDDMPEAELIAPDMAETEDQVSEDETDPTAETAQESDRKG